MHDMLKPILWKGFNWFKFRRITTLNKKKIFVRKKEEKRIKILGIVIVDWITNKKSENLSISKFSW